MNGHFRVLLFQISLEVHLGVGRPCDQYFPKTTYRIGDCLEIGRVVMRMPAPDNARFVMKMRGGGTVYDLRIFGRSVQVKSDNLCGPVI